MAVVTKTFIASSPTDLETAVNAYLAGLVNPIVRGLTCRFDNAARRTGGEFFVAVVTETGGAALATPFLLNVIQARKNVDLDTAVAAFIAANPAAFFPAPRYDRQDTDGRLSTFVAFVFYNTAGAASANWLPL